MKQKNGQRRWKDQLRAPGCSLRRTRHLAAREEVSYRVPSTACHRQSSFEGSIGCSTSSATIVAPFWLGGAPRRVTTPRQTTTRNSPRTALPASANQETLTAAAAAWSTHPVGVRCCSTGPGSCLTRLITRSGASSSSNAVTERCTALFAFAVGEASQGEAIGCVGSFTYKTT